MKSVLAIDIGATSGRAVLARIEGGQLIMEEINRFANTPIKERGHLCWNVDFLFSKILESIQKAVDQSELLSIGIDTWGVDFVLMNSEGERLSLPVHYRDGRTNEILESVSQMASLSDLYYKTGNQLMEINTLFQLLAARKEAPDDYYKVDKLLMMPDYFHFLLTGKKAIERSIASTTQMINPITSDWNHEILALFDISASLLPSIVKEGTILGKVKPEFGFGDVKVVNVCEHDTASAVVAIPCQGQDCLFISSGTWSLIGTEISAPIISQKSLEYNFTNETGHDGTTTFLKNCTGLWIVEELRREYKLRRQCYSFEDIMAMVIACDSEVAIVDTESPEFAEPDRMIEKIRRYAERTNQAIPITAGEVFKSAYLSLAHKYKEVIKQLEELTANTYQTLNLIGGGSKSEYFSQLVADVTGKTVMTGLTEATAIGNSIIQMIAMGEIETLTSAKEMIRQSITTTYYYPTQKEVIHDSLS